MSKQIDGRSGARATQSIAGEVIFSTPDGDIPMKDALRDPELRQAVEGLLRAPLIKEGWILEDRPLDGFEPWIVQVRIAPMPDGSSAITGIRIEPRDDFEGSLFDQRVTSTTLRKVPLSVLRHEAIGWKKLLVEENPEGWVDSIVNKFESLTDLDRRTLREVRVEEVGEKQVQLEEVIEAYQYAGGNPAGGSRRQQVAKILGVCERTVDRRLMKARKAGLLERFPGRQGKHGSNTSIGREINNGN